MLIRKDPNGRPLFDSQASESRPDLSPDGRWIAYRSDESGRFDGPYLNDSGRNYDIAPDGHFLMVRLADDANLTPWDSHHRSRTGTEHRAARSKAVR